MARGVSKQDEALWQLEDIIALINRAQDHIRVTHNCIRARLKTVREAADLQELEQADATLDEAIDELSGWHPSALRGKRGTE